MAEPADRPTETASPPWLRLAPAVFLLLWSAGYSFGKMALAHAEPMTLLALRYGLVLVLLVPLLLIVRPPLPRRRADWLHLAVVGFLIQASYFGLFYLALELGVSAGAGALILSLQPILTALAAPRLTGEQVDRRLWLALGLGMAGAAIVILARSRIEVTSVAGILAATGSLLSITAGALYEKRFGGAHHPVASNAIQYAVGLLVLLPVAAGFEEMRIEWTDEFLVALAYLVLGNSLVAVTLLLAMIRHGAVARVSLLMFLVPPAASLFAWLIIDEPVPPLAWIGMVLAGIGIAMAGPLLRSARS